MCDFKIQIKKEIKKFLYYIIDVVPIKFIVVSICKHFVVKFVILLIFLFIYYVVYVAQITYIHVNLLVFVMKLVARLAFSMKHYCCLYITFTNYVYEFIGIIEKCYFLHLPYVWMDGYWEMR